MIKPNEEQNSEFINTNQYLLSILFNSEGFEFWVYNEFKVLLSSKKVSGSLFSMTTNEIIKLLTQELLLNYQTVRLICESDQYTFVPEPFFKEEHAADFLHFQFKPSKNDQICINTIPKWNTVNVYSIPKTLHDALRQFFPNANIEHHLSYLLIEQVKLRNADSVYISVRSNIMDVVVIKDGGIQLINSYSFNTPEDFTYHTLNLFDKIPLNAENCDVFLFNADKKPDLRKTLELYLEVTEVISDK